VISPDVRVEQGGGARCPQDRVVRALLEVLERLDIAAQDGGLHAAARLDLGQVHDGIDQVRPPAGGDVPGRRVQRGPGGSRGGHGDLGRGDDSVAVFDFDVTWRFRMVHRVLLPGDRRTRTAASLTLVWIGPCPKAAGMKPGRNRFAAYRLPPRGLRTRR
jgi:hypothetical protein